MNASDIKAALRAEMRSQRMKLSAAERELFSCKLVQNVLSWEIYKKARHVMIYYPAAGEIDLLGLTKAAEGKTFLLPKTGENFTMAVGEYKGGELVSGKYGILEPKESLTGAEIDLVLAPAVACDRFGVRLGQGGGYYDRFLREIRESGRKTVFAAAVYDFQLVNSLRAEPHDVMMDYLATPSGIYAAGKY
jgi:5-formyltetrahydrofolate cyclo-ligase